MSAEHHHAGGPIRIQTLLQHFRPAIELKLAIKARVDDHPGGLVNARFVQNRSARLGYGARGSANEVLRLIGLDPKVRREIRQVGENGRIGNFGVGERRSLIHGAVEIGHHGDDQIGLRRLPMPAQLTYQGFVAQTNEHLQDTQFLRQAQGPAAREPHVIVVFRLDPGGSAKYILRIEDFEQIDQPDLPVFVLFANGRLEGDGGGAMPSSRIDVHQIDRCHSRAF